MPVATDALTTRANRSAPPAPRAPAERPELVSTTLPRATPARRAAALRRLAADAGQGTVEYVGLLLLMASILAAIVVAAGSLGGQDKIGKSVVEHISTSIDKAGTDPKAAK